MAMFRSFIAGKRAARRIGAADKRETRGDTEGVLRAYAEALEILDRPGVDLETAVCGSCAMVALLGYSRTAAQLQRHAELTDMLARWRTRYLPWLAAPLTSDEAQYLKWLEEVLKAQGE
jgi:hypothetical protein